MKDLTITLDIALAQLNPTLGDLDGNAAQITQHWSACEADLIVFPELFLTGYPPEDLILNQNFIGAVREKTETLIKDSKAYTAAALISVPWVIDGKTHNAAHLIHAGKILHTQTKHHLPNYGVFDEKRIFEPGPMPNIVEFKGIKLGILICEDMWFDDVPAHLKAQGAEILIVPNASPFEIGKHDRRVELAKRTGLPLHYVNMVGGQDELVFDGGSFVMDSNGEITEQFPFFEAPLPLPQGEGNEASASKQSEDGLAAVGEGLPTIRSAIVTAIRDYVHKNGFSDVLLGLSGGIDSALTAALAVEAIGPDHARCIMLPSEFTSDESLEDAKECAEYLGVSYEIISIENTVKAFETTIPNLSGLAHENTQSRIRGTILMALSNASGALLLTTGNKSEMAVGYCTLYGDMNGAFNPLKDLYKTQVYTLAKQMNIKPERILTKAPSAELREGQTDQDSLPPYDVLDDILVSLVEREQPISAIKHDRATVEKVAKLLRLSEYKRFQSAPGPKLTQRAFGRDRRYPMTNRF